MRISDWSSDVCSSDLQHHAERLVQQHRLLAEQGDRCRDLLRREHALRVAFEPVDPVDRAQHFGDQRIGAAFADILHDALDDVIAAREDQRLELVQLRSEEHTSELQSLMRISYAVFCLKKTNPNTHHDAHTADTALT